MKPFKFRRDPETAGRLEGKTVSLQRTLIYRANQTMIEVTGEVERQGDWLILRADPVTYRRVSK